MILSQLIWFLCNNTAYRCKKQKRVHFYYYYFELLNYQTSSIKAALPIPVPIQRDTSPFFFPLRLSSLIIEPIRRPPVAPRGCPIPTLPPLTFTISLFSPRILIHPRLVLVNASWISIKSISSGLMWGFYFRSFGIAFMGPSPERSGAIPATA